MSATERTPRLPPPHMFSSLGFSIPTALEIDEEPLSLGFLQSAVRSNDDRSTAKPPLRSTPPTMPLHDHIHSQRSQSHSQSQLYHDKGDHKDGDKDESFSTQSPIYYQQQQQQQQHHGHLQTSPSDSASIMHVSPLSNEASFEKIRSIGTNSLSPIGFAQEAEHHNRRHRTSRSAAKQDFYLLLESADPEACWNALEGLLQVLRQKKDSVSIGPKLFPALMKALDRHFPLAGDVSSLVFECCVYLRDYCTRYVERLFGMFSFLIQEFVVPSFETPSESINLTASQLLHTLLMIDPQYTLESIFQELEIGNDAQSSIRNQILFNLLANDPFIQRKVIVPIVQRELDVHNENRRKLAAVIVLGKLFDRASQALGSLTPYLASGVLDRKLVAWAIRHLGCQGEDFLLETLRRNPHEQARESAAVGLGLSTFVDPPYIKFEVCEFDIVGKQKPGLLLHFPGKSKGQTSHHTSDYKIATDLDWKGFDTGYLCIDRFLLQLRSFAVETCVQDLNMQDSDFPRPQVTLEDSQEKLELSQSAVVALIAGMADPKATVRAASALSFSLSDSFPIIPGLVEGLIKCAKDVDQKVRESAFTSLSRIGPTILHLHPSIIPLMTAALKDHHYQVRHAACIGLGELRESASSSLPQLLRILKDGTLNRTTVTKTLIRLGSKGEAAIHRLLQGESNPSNEEKCAALHGAAHIELSSPNFPVLLPLASKFVRDPSPTVRASLISFLNILLRRLEDGFSADHTRDYCLKILRILSKDLNASIRAQATDLLEICNSMSTESVKAHQYPSLETSSQYSYDSHVSSPRSIAASAVNQLLDAEEGSRKSVISWLINEGDDFLARIQGEIDQEKAIELHNAICDALTSTSLSSQERLKVKLFLQRLSAQFRLDS